MVERKAPTKRVAKPKRPPTPKDEALARVRGRERAARRKMSRIRNVVGAEIKGSKYDVLRDKDKVKNYNVQQLEHYEKQLNGFINRGTQFAPLRNGTPVLMKMWKNYKLAEAKRNKAIEDFYNKHKDLTLPDGNKISTRMNKSQHKNARTHKPVNPLFNPLERDSRGIRDEKALAKLTKKLESMPPEKFIKNDLRQAKKQLEQMLGKMGDDETLKKVKKLSDNQFHVMWSYTGFAADIATRYEFEKLRSARSEKGEGVPTFVDEIGPRRMASAHELIEWASDLKV